VNRHQRLLLFAVGAAVLTGFYVAASLDLPAFGGTVHPYRDLAVHAAFAHATANAVASVTFDSRGIDTLIEEAIMLASVLGAAALLRPAAGEQERHVRKTGIILGSTQLIGYVMLPLTLVVGIDLVVHGHLTPGGGFQGGVVLATAIHLLYVAGSFPAVQRIRPLAIHQVLEGVAAAAFACIGLAGLAAAGSFLANYVPRGSFGQLFSGGTVPVLNGVVAVEIAASVVVLIASFLDQEIVVSRDHGGDG
jgi:multicomponent Na+:H+ antiporter subunit B